MVAIFLSVFAVSLLTVDKVFITERHFVLKKDYVYNCKEQKEIIYILSEATALVEDADVDDDKDDVVDDNDDVVDDNDDVVDDNDGVISFFSSDAQHAALATNVFNCHF